MLAPSSDDGVVVVDDRLVGKCTSRRTSSRCSNPSRMVPMRWPVPSEWSAVATGLRLGRVVRDARLPYLRNQTICNTNVPYTHATSLEHSVRRNINMLFVDQRQPLGLLIRYTSMPK